MGKQLRCSDLGMDCDFTAWAETEKELMELVALHAKQAHGIDEVGPELKEKVESAIRDA